MFKPSHYLQACTQNFLKHERSLLTKHYVKLNQYSIDAIDQS